MGIAFHLLRLRAVFTGVRPCEWSNCFKKNRDGGTLTSTEIDAFVEATTLDKPEAMPGFRVDLSIEEFERTLAKVGMAMIGQTRDVAPADRKLYALYDVTGTVESVPLITASIMRLVSTLLRIRATKRPTAIRHCSAFIIEMKQAGHGPSCC